MAESRAKDTRDSTRHPCLNGYSVSRADSRECASSRYATLGNAGQVLAALVGEGQTKERKRVERRHVVCCTYLRAKVNVHTFSAQIEYVPVSGVGADDNLVSICGFNKCSDSFGRLLREFLS